MQLIIAIVRWVVSVLYAYWYGLQSSAPVLFKDPTSWKHAIMALGAILLIVANFNKIPGRLNLALVSLLLMLVAALLLGALSISPLLIYMLVISVIIYLLFYFSRGKY